MDDPASYLLVLGEREAIRWVVTSGQMAFPATPRREVAALREGDHLFLVTTRGAFHSPGKDRTRLIGTGVATTKVVPLDDTLEIAGRVFKSGCSIRITALAPYREGIELGPLTNQLEALRGKAHWGMQLRRPLVPIGEADAMLLSRELGRQHHDLRTAMDTYRGLVPPVSSLR